MFSCFESPKWFLAYYSIFRIKTAPVVRSLLGSAKDGLNPSLAEHYMPLANSVDPDQLAFEEAN